MKILAALIPLAIATASGALPAQQPAPAPAAVSEAITVEHYYRIRWGSGEEFKRLYERNHAPLLRDMQAQGFITSLRTDEPFTHMAGDQRWDLRVTISASRCWKSIGT
jgi:hypothetical protein